MRERGNNVIGVRSLIMGCIYRYYRPKKYRKRVHGIANNREILEEYLKIYQGLCKESFELYKKAKRGIYVKFPPGIFPPPTPLLANAI